MKTLILAISLFFAGSLWAEWSSIGDNDVDTLYVDLESMHPRGHMRRVLELQDLKRRGKKGELSVLTKLEFDCSKSTYRILAVTTYAGSMAQGKKISSKTVNPQTWLAVEEETDGETVFDTVCAQ
jgi:hypothetical protein